MDNYEKLINNNIQKENLIHKFENGLIAIHKLTSEIGYNLKLKSKSIDLVSKKMFEESLACVDKISSTKIKQ